MSVRCIVCARAHAQVHTHSFRLILSLSLSLCMCMYVCPQHWENALWTSPCTILFRLISCRFAVWLNVFSSLLFILFYFIFFGMCVCVTHRFHKLNCLLQFGKRQMKSVSETTEELQWVQAGRVSVCVCVCVFIWRNGRMAEWQMERVTIVFLCWFLHIAFVVRLSCIFLVLSLLYFHFISTNKKNCAFGRCWMHPILTCRRNIH